MLSWKKLHLLTGMVAFIVSNVQSRGFRFDSRCVPAGALLCNSFGEVAHIPLHLSPNSIIGRGVQGGTSTTGYVVYHA